MPDLNFDVNGARQAGYSDAEIVDFMAQDKNSKFDVPGALKAGYSPSEIITHLSGASAAPVASAAPAASAAPSGGVMDFVKSVPHGMLDRIGSMLSASGAAANAEMSQPDNPNPTPQEATQALKDNVTGETHAPEGLPGKIGAGLGGAAVDPTSYIGPGGPLKNVVMSGAGALGGELAGAATNDNLAAKFGGNVAAAILMHRAMTPRPATAVAPTRDELQGAYDSQYAGGRDIDAAIHPQVMGATAQNVRQDLYNAGIRPNAAPQTHGLLDEIDAATARGGDFDMKNLSALRQDLTTARNAGGKESRAANILGDAIDNMVDTLPQQRAYFTGPTGMRIGGSPVTQGSVQDVQDAMRMFRTGDGNYAAGMRNDMLTGKLGTAELKSATENSGMNLENKLRQAVVSTLANRDMQRGFSAHELQQMERFSRGTIGMNALRQIGNRLGGGGGWASMALTAASAPVLGAGAAAIPLAGFAARMTSNAIAARRAAALEALSRMNSPLGRARQAAVGPQATQPSVLPIAVLRALSQADVQPQN